MDRPFGTLHFWTTPPVTDREAGSTALRLHRKMGDKIAVVAEVVYWDALGHYFVNTFGSEVPLEVLEELFAEAKDLIRYK